MLYVRILFAIVFPYFVASYGLRKKSLTLSGAVLGYIIGCIMAYANICYIASLLAFFISGSKLTRLKSSSKRQQEENYDSNSSRNWQQVLCNGGAATLCSICYLVFASAQQQPELPIDFRRYPSPSYISCSVLCAIACASGDTWASEVGSVCSWGRPRLVTNLRVVPHGTNGGVSFVGTLASAVGGAVVGLAYYFCVCSLAPASHLSASCHQLSIVCIAAAAGCVGSFIDSLLGATLQFSGFNIDTGKVTEEPGPRVRPISGWHVLNNHAVNLLATLLTCLIVPRIALRLAPPIDDWLSGYFS